MMKPSNPSPHNSTVLVVGGGIGGIRCALDLAASGKNVLMVDKANTIGGLMTQLDRTFPTNNCDLCTISPDVSEESRSRHIEWMPLTELAALEGEAGRFTATLHTMPRYIDTALCTACGECQRQFPECVEFKPGLDHRAPTCMRYPQATPQAYRIDPARVRDWEALARCCPAGAIRPEDTEKRAEVGVGSVVLAMGASIFDPAVLDNFSYGKDPDVVTSLEYERILSASGPTGGNLVCPSNGRVPEKIAWIQCVGSRGLQKNAMPYCSSACCMFALKEATVTKERFQQSIDTAIFYMDIRTFGKDYELYYERCRSQYGIRFVRSRPHSVFRKPGEDRLTVTYASEEASAMIEDKFDLVVLSTGFHTSAELQAMAKAIGVELNAYGFAASAPFDPVATSRPGVYVCGMFESPKDIPETMIQASAAACRASAHVEKAIEAPADPEAEIPEEIPEIDVSGQDPRIGVFICECGENIGGVIDVADLTEFSAKLPGVVVSRAVGHGCSRGSMEAIRESIIENRLNRVVIGGCSPRTHEIRFQDLIRKAGLNRNLLEIANLRDQDTWVHYDHLQDAKAKARQLMWAAVSSVRKARALADNRLEMNPDVLVVGGGVAGMSASLRLADQGKRVFLVERRSMLGGTANLVHKTIEGDDVTSFVRDLVEKTMNHPNIQVITSAFIVDHSGIPGLFKTGLQIGPKMFYRQISHGATILATGAIPNRPELYLLGRHPAVMTQLDADAILAEQADSVKNWNTVVMIQCVGSRVPGNPNCSRICCQAAIKNALAIKAVHPEARIFVLYRDIRTYGFQELYYQKAREAGVVFVRYEPENPPVVSADGAQVEVTFHDPIIDRRLAVSADALLLSTGFAVDEESAEDLAAIFRLPRTPDGYFLEDHIKLRPVDLPVPGFFVAGTAHAPKSIRESVAQAEAAASRAMTMLSKQTVELPSAVAHVDSKRCAACLICVRVCPFGVPFINADGYSQIDPVRCRGCGLCASECPAKAIQLMKFEDDQILEKLNGLLERMVL